MSRLAPLDVRDAHFDGMRDAVVIPAGRNVVVVVRDALESLVNRSLDGPEAVLEATENGALLRTVANAQAANDGVITITNGVLNGRDWSVRPYEGDPEDSGPIYAEPPTAEWNA